MKEEKEGTGNQDICDHPDNVYRYREALSNECPLGDDAMNGGRPTDLQMGEVCPCLQVHPERKYER